MGESGIDISTRNEIETAREINVGLLPKGLECIGSTIIWLHLHASQSNAWEGQLLRCVLQVTRSNNLNISYEAMTIFFI